jgi:hypothetical protein
VKEKTVEMTALQVEVDETIYICRMLKATTRQIVIGKSQCEVTSE